MKTRGGQILFSEEQRFTQSWLWLLLIAGVIVSVVVAALFAASEGIGEMAESVVVMTVTGCLALAMMNYFRLSVSVVGDGIQVRFRPFIRRTIRCEDIQSWKARNYRPIREYGGWGIRWGPRGKAYNVMGNRGVQLVLASGERLLIGSQRADELAAAITALKAR